MAFEGTYQQEDNIEQMNVPGYAAAQKCLPPLPVYDVPAIMQVEYPIFVRARLGFSSQVEPGPRIKFLNDHWEIGIDESYWQYSIEQLPLITVNGTLAWDVAEGFKTYSAVCAANYRLLGCLAQGKYPKCTLTAFSGIGNTVFTLNSNEAQLLLDNQDSKELLRMLYNIGYSADRLDVESLYDAVINHWEEATRVPAKSPISPIMDLYAYMDAFALRESGSPRLAYVIAIMHFINTQNEGMNNVPDINSVDVPKQPAPYAQIEEGLNDAFKEHTFKVIDIPDERKPAIERMNKRMQDRMMSVGQDDITTANETMEANRSEKSEAPVVPPAPVEQSPIEQEANWASQFLEVESLEKEPVQEIAENVPVPGEGPSADITTEFADEEPAATSAASPHVSPLVNLATGEVFENTHEAALADNLKAATERNVDEQVPEKPAKPSMMEKLAMLIGGQPEGSQLTEEDIAQLEYIINKSKAQKPAQPSLEKVDEVAQETESDDLQATTIEANTLPSRPAAEVERPIEEMPETTLLQEPEMDIPNMDMYDGNVYELIDKIKGLLKESYPESDLPSIHCGEVTVRGDGFIISAKIEPDYMSGLQIKMVKGVNLDDIQSCPASVKNVMDLLNSWVSALSTLGLKEFLDSTKEANRRNQS